MTEKPTSLLERKLKRLEQEKKQMEQELARLLTLTRGQQQTQQFIEQFALAALEVDSLETLTTLLDDVLRGQLGGAKWRLHLPIQTIPHQHLNHVAHLNQRDCRRHLHLYFSEGQTEYACCPEHTQDWLFTKKGTPFIKIIPLGEINKQGFLALGFEEYRPLSCYQTLFNFLIKTLNILFVKFF